MKTENPLSPINMPLAVLAILASVQVSSLAQTNLPTLAVAKTKPQGIASWQPALGEGLANMFISELNKLGKFRVLESVALDDVREEQALVQSGEVSAAEGVKKGEWSGADYTFKSIITRFGAKESSAGGGGRLPVPIPIPNPLRGGHVRINKQEHEVQIDWRIIDNQTRDIVPGASGSAVGKESATGFDFGTRFGNGFQNTREFRDSALGKATVKAIAQIIQQVQAVQVGPGGRAIAIAQNENASKATLRRAKGTIQMVDGNEVWISLGSRHGIEKGETLCVYEPQPKRNSKGEVVTIAYKKMGQLRLLTVKTEKSMGEYSGVATPAEEWIVAAAEVDIDQLD